MSHDDRATNPYATPKQPSDCTANKPSRLDFAQRILPYIGVICVFTGLYTSAYSVVPEQQWLSSLFSILTLLIGALAFLAHKRLSSERT